MYDPAQLGERIRRFRKARGMSQAVLAEKLFLSPQNVSKWENGKSAPDVENLCRLAEVLGVGTDHLLYSAQEPLRHVMIGVDGGGTKTEFCAFDAAGHVLGRIRLGGTNPNVYGLETTIAVLKEGIDALTGQKNGPCAVFAGIAGCGVNSNRHAVLSALKKAYPGVRIEVRNDAYNVVYSTPYHEKCIMAIMGTGSVVFAKTEKEFIRLGGWGYLFDNGFSGYAIGREAIMAALGAEDGVGEPTLLLDMLKEELNGGIFQNVPVLYAKPKEEIAAYAKLVFRAYEKGDAVAGEILRARAEALRHQIKRASEMYDVGTRVILAGGLTRDREIVMSLLDTARFQYVIPTLPPIFGACSYCARMLGEPSEEFAANFEKEYTSLAKE